ncbi:MAG: hypothetical protein P8P49_07340 [Opitutales bacterium]|nr:hypothetical protein [Opitutales bacterium]
MEGITPDKLHMRPSINHGPYISNSKSVSSSLPSSGDEIAVKISNISQLSQKAAESSDDVRPDVMERARTLLDDPNWLNNDSLELLAGKIVDEEQL